MNKKYIDQCIIEEINKEQKISEQIDLQLVDDIDSDKEKFSGVMFTDVINSTYIPYSSSFKKRFFDELSTSNKLNYLKLTSDRPNHNLTGLIDSISHIKNNKIAESLTDSLIDGVQNPSEHNNLEYIIDDLLESFCVDQLDNIVKILQIDTGLCLDKIPSVRSFLKSNLAMILNYDPGAKRLKLYTQKQQQLAYTFQKWLDLEWIYLP